jgi:hypothetical protein
MEEEIKIFVEQLENTWSLFLHKIPAIILALLVLAIGGFVIKFTSKYADNLSSYQTFSCNNTLYMPTCVLFSFNCIAHTCNNISL